MTNRGRRVLAAACLAATVAPLSGQSARPAVCDADARPANLTFTIKDLQGADVALDTYRGKVILLDFWATWCGPCKIEIPGFIELYSRYRSEGLQVLGFAVDDPVPAIEAYASQMKMNYPILVGQGRDDVLEAFGPMPGLPTTFIIDRNGIICTSHTGFTEKETFEETIAALL
jgi:thiol-disulfide isomerase/thioredoxin